MTITKTIHGSWSISAIIKGYLETRQYYGYTKRQAIREFKREMKGQN